MSDPWADPMLTHITSGYGPIECVAKTEYDRVCTERDGLRQAIWDAYGILGFDQDGDREPRTADLAGLIVWAVTEFRADYDEAGQTEGGVMSDPWAKQYYRDAGDSDDYGHGAVDGYNAALPAVRPEYDRVCAERDELRRIVSELRHRLAFYEPPPKAKQ